MDMLETRSGQSARRPHAAALPPVPSTHPLECLAARAGAILSECAITLLQDGCDPPLLLVELLDDHGSTDLATWLVSVASPDLLRLETLHGETKLDMLAEAPPDRILARLAAGVARAQTARRPALAPARRSA